MNSEKNTVRFVALLRGINVGGHHKLPMAELHKEMEALDLENVITLLNSGNVIFNSKPESLKNLEKIISERLESTFGFPVPTIIRTAETIYQLHKAAPFQDVELTKDIRCYVSFLKENSPSDLEFPWISTDHSFKIIEKKDQALLSVLDLSITKTPKAMKVVEDFYGTEITTRNWKTIERIIKKLEL